MKKTTIILFLFFGYIGFVQSTNFANKVVGYVNEEPIIQKEYTFFSSKYRSSVISKFRNEYKLNYHTNFWHDNSKGKTPSEVLDEMTKESIVKSKIQYLLAKEYGIINDVSFHFILKHLEDENLQRRKALNKNTVIYGPEQYSLESYYEYLTSNMIIKVKDYMLKNDIISIDTSKGIRRENHSTMHDDDKHYSNVHIVNTQINYQYNEIIQELIDNAKIKFDENVNP